MNTTLILIAVIISTSLGDYLIKLASAREAGLSSLPFLLGAVFYGLPAIGFFHLMRGHSLAAVGVFYSTTTIILMAAMGALIFKEAFGLREGIGVGLAVLSVIVIGHEG